MVYLAKLVSHICVPGAWYQPQGNNTFPSLNRADSGGHMMNVNLSMSHAYQPREIKQYDKYIGIYLSMLFFLFVIFYIMLHQCRM